MQRISSILETGMVLIPAFINLGIIIYAMYFSRREEKLGIGGTIAYLLFYAVVLISFCISVTVAIMLYMDIIPQIGRFF
jgi:hypothetical protein